MSLATAFLKTSRTAASLLRCTAKLWAASSAALLYFSQKFCLQWHHKCSLQHPSLHCQAFQLNGIIVLLTMLVIMLLTMLLTLLINRAPNHASNPAHNRAPNHAADCYRWHDVRSKYS